MIAVVMDPLLSNCWFTPKQKECSSFVFALLKLNKQWKMVMIGKPFHFRGCGWSKPVLANWDEENIAFIHRMNGLFANIFGGDFLDYEGNKTCSLSEPSYTYDHDTWEKDLQNTSEVLVLPTHSADPDHSFPMSPTVKPDQLDTDKQSDDVDVEDKNELRGDLSSCAFSQHQSSSTSTPAYPDLLKLGTTSQMTREEMAALDLPPVSNLSPSLLKADVNPENLTFPWNLNFT